MFNLSLSTAEILIGVITLLCAYLISVSITGFLRAWIADAMGDSTGKDLGFLTLNPFAHVDIVGLMVLFWIGFGWGRYIPVLPERVGNRFKAMIVAFSDTIAHALLYFFGLCLLIVMLGSQAPGIVLAMFHSRIPVLSLVTQHFPALSSFTSIVVLIVVGITFLNLVLATVSLIRNSLLPIIQLVLRSVPAYWEHKLLFDFICLLLALMLLGNVVLVMLVRFGFMAGTSLCSLFVS